MSSTSATLVAMPTAVASRTTALSRAAEARFAVTSRIVPTYAARSSPSEVTELMLTTAHVIRPSRCRTGVSD